MHVQKSVQAAAVGQVQVEQHDIHISLREPLASVRKCGNGLNVKRSVPALFQELLYYPDVYRIVVDHQYEDSWVAHDINLADSNGNVNRRGESAYIEPNKKSSLQTSL